MTKSKGGILQSQSKNAYVDRNEKNLLHSLTKIKQFRANLDNNEFKERFFDKDRHKKKIEDDDDEDVTPEEFVNSLLKKTKEQSKYIQNDR